MTSTSPTEREIQPRSRTLRVFRSVAEIDAERGRLGRFDWYRIDPHPGYFLTVVRSSPRVLRPHVIAVEQDGRLESALVARLERTTLDLRVGYATLRRLPVDAVVVVPGGISVDEDAMASGTLIAGLMAALASGEGDAAIIPNVRVGSGLHDAIGRVPAICRQQFSQARVHRRLVLPESFDAFLASSTKSVRYDVRRCEKRVQKDFGDRVGYVTLRSPEDLSQLVADLESVAAKTYQRRLAVGFSTDDAYRSRVAYGLEHGLYQAHIVYLDDSPIAFVDGFVHGGTFFFSSTGYDPALASHRVGIYVQIQMLKALCADPGVTAVDYGSGEAEYKRRFANESWFETDVVLFPANARGLARNALCSAFAGSNRAAQALLTRVSLLDRLKRAWRQRLAEH